MVDIAPQRNQNSAFGAITLLTAGFCSSGIFGIDGICTKLKYQSRPIHITPEMTCSQRMTNAPQAWSYWIPLPATRMRTMTRTTPAATVRPSDWKIAPISRPPFMLIYVDRQEGGLLMG